MTAREIDTRLRLLPPIRRARFWRLYAQDGSRFLDFHQDGGRGILGARSAGLGASMKASLDRGLDRPLPSHHEARLAKAALGLWLRARALRLYRSEEAALAIVAKVSGIEARGTDFLDSPLVSDSARTSHAKGDGSAAPAFILRPFSKWLPPSAIADIAVPLLPLARGLGPAILLFADEASAEKAGPGELLPPFLVAAAIGALAALGKYEAEAKESQWARMDRRSSHLFERRGPWLFPRVSGEAYGRIFEAALARGLLLSPDPSLPSIVPGDLDDGEIAPLSTLSI